MIKAVIFQAVFEEERDGTFAAPQYSVCDAMVAIVSSKVTTVESGGWLKGCGPQQEAEGLDHSKYSIVTFDNGMEGFVAGDYLDVMRELGIGCE